MTKADIVIVGAGIAGAGLAAAIGSRASVLLLEREAQPGAHATGRSAAFWTESYGGSGVSPLTTASEAALAPYLHRRGALHVGRAGDRDRLDRFVAGFDGSIAFETIDPAALVPGLRPDWTLGLSEPSCADIDVARLHADLLASARASGARLICDAAVCGIERLPGGWRIATAAGPVEASLLVNAAGAWADGIAAMAGARPIGIVGYRRTVVQLRTDPPVPAGLPLVIDLAGAFYFKPGSGGRLWLSPHDETPVDPGDAQPEEIDVALAIARLESVVDWRIEAVERKWAGLRSFAPDRLPVYGFAPDRTGFFWCAGQGGFGIQTAPAASSMAAALLLGDAGAGGIDPARYRPDRPMPPPGR